MFEAYVIGEATRTRAGSAIPYRWSLRAPEDLEHTKTSSDYKGF